jgi:cytochrome c2
VVGQVGASPDAGKRNVTGELSLPSATRSRWNAGRRFDGVRCTFCHGADARGGEGGPNLVRSGLVLNDIKGRVNRSGGSEWPPEMGMPKFDLNSRSIGYRLISPHLQGGRTRPPREMHPNVLVGDAKAGQAYFSAKCASCHSVTVTQRSRV